MHNISSAAVARAAAAQPPCRFQQLSVDVDIDADVGEGVDLDVELNATNAWDGATREGGTGITVRLVGGGVSPAGADSDCAAAAAARGDCDSPDRKRLGRVGVVLDAAHNALAMARLFEKVQVAINSGGSRKYLV